MAFAIQSFDVPRLIESIVDEEIPVEDTRAFLEDVLTLLRRHCHLEGQVAYDPSGNYCLKLWASSTDAAPAAPVLQRYELTQKNQSLYSDKHPLL